VLLSVLVAFAETLLGTGCGGDDGGCANAVLEEGEACDDGNTNSGDGCSSTCALEPGWSCSAPAGGKTTCAPVCGDGILVCSEVCDDGNTSAGDGCSPSCFVENGWECSGAPSACALLPARVRTPPSLGAPITGLPDRQWSYVEFPNTTCGDGSPAGLFISSGSQELLFWLDGGYSCADYALCSWQRSQGYHGPISAPALLYDLSSFNSAGFWDGTVFSRSDLDNVFRDYTFVYVPLCTADLHGGDAVVTYAQSLTVHHRGHANVVAYLDRAAATWPSPTRLVVGGSSAGGFGTLINYDTFRLYWPIQKLYLIDDSGPLLADITPASWMTDGWVGWNVAAAVGDVCPTCSAPSSAIYSALQRWYPNDRKSLVSYLQDHSTASIAYGVTFDQLEAGLRSTASTALGPNRWGWYFTEGQGHAPLYAAAWGSGPAMSAIRSAGVSLPDYLRAQIDGDPTWCPVTPP
jgi:cysteine-rich repeat protein